MEVTEEGDMEKANKGWLVIPLTTRERDNTEIIYQTMMTEMKDSVGIWRKMYNRESPVTTEGPRVIKSRSENTTRSMRRVNFEETFGEATLEMWQSNEVEVWIRRKE